MTLDSLLAARDAAAFDAGVRTLCRLKSAAWRAVREFGDNPTGVNAEASSAAARAVEAEEEDFRLAFFPNALKVFVLADDERGHGCSIYAVFPSGPECVFEAHAERVA